MPLFDLYQSQGKKLPSVSERSLIFEQKGLGPASTYRGTATQNIALEKALRTLGVSTPPPTRELPVTQTAPQESTRELPSQPAPQVAPQPQESPVTKPFSYNDLISTMQNMFTAAQSAPQTGDGDSDLIARRNEIIKARYSEANAPLAENLRYLSPNEQINLRQLRDQKYREELSGLDTALQTKERRREGERKAAEQAQQQKFQVGQLLLDALKGQQEEERKSRELQLKSQEQPSISDKYGTGVIGEYNFYAEQERGAGRKPLSFNEYQTADANRKRSIQNTYIQGGLNKDQFNRLNTIADNARQDDNIKTFAPVRASYETARDAAKNNNSAGDIVLMRMLAKITDPTTGVREEEYRTFKDAVGTLPRLGVQVTKQLTGKGQLTEQGRKVLLKEVENIYKQREAAYKNSIENYRSLAEKNGGTLEDVMPVYLAPEAQGQTETKILNGKVYEKIEGGWRLKK